MASKKAKVRQRWEQASADISSSNTTEDTRFSWEKAEDDKNLPSYEELVPGEKETGWEIRTAPTNNAERPRASTVGYNLGSGSLIIIFRSGACCRYEKITPQMWMDLRDGNSTNDFVNGPLAGYPYSYCDRADMSDEVNARIEYTNETSGRIQRGRQSEQKGIQLE